MNQGDTEFNAQQRHADENKLHPMSGGATAISIIESLPSTPNHDTELEEWQQLIWKAATANAGNPLGYKLLDAHMSALDKIYSERAYKQTLELIENAPVVNIAGGPHHTSERIDKAQFRKAAAERWGQE